MKKIIVAVIIVLLIVSLGALYYYQTKQIRNLEQTLNEKSLNGEQNKFTQVPVEKLGDEYFIGIPEGNKSYCVWRYSAGSGNIPNIEMTEAKTLSEKHHLSLGGAFWDFSVYCLDDWGNNYVGNLEK